MTNYYFKNLLKVDIKCKDDGYTSKARLVEFHYNAQDVPMALVFNEETKRFKNIPVYEILRVYENPVCESETDELTEMWVRLFGDNSGVMETFRNRYTIQKDGDNIIIVPKDNSDKTEYVIVRKMNDAEKAVLEEFEGVDKQIAHDINEMRLEMLRSKQETCAAVKENTLEDKAKEYYENAQQTEEPKTEAVPDEDWKYNGGSC